MNEKQRWIFYFILLIIDRCTRVVYYVYGGMNPMYARRLLLRWNESAGQERRRYGLGLIAIQNLQGWADSGLDCQIWRSRKACFSKCGI